MNLLCSSATIFLKKHLMIQDNIKLLWNKFNNIFLWLLIS